MWKFNFPILVLELQCFQSAVDSLFMLILCEPPSRKIKTFSDIATECTPCLLTYAGTFNVSLQLSECARDFDVLW